MTVSMQLFDYLLCLLLRYDKRDDDASGSSAPYPSTTGAPLLLQPQVKSESDAAKARGEDPESFTLIRIHHLIHLC